MKLSDVINAELKRKSTEEIDQLVKGIGEKNNLTFSEAGLDEEIIKLQTINYDGDTAYYVKGHVTYEEFVKAWYWYHRDHHDDHHKSTNYVTSINVKFLATQEIASTG